MAFDRHFLPWDRPLLPQAVDFLAGKWSGDGPLNLADLLVVVPTRQSGRRLREALAAKAESRNAAVFPPRVVLPESLTSLGAPPADVASRLESQLAWVAVFRALDLAEFRAVFPLDPPTRTFSWASRLAQEFGRLQSALAESGLRLADVASKLGADFPEAERWVQIARLETRQAAKLATLGRRDAQAAKLARAEAPSLPPGIRRLVLLGTPDPLPLALKILEHHARTLPVDVVVFAPAAEAAAFDAWGQPQIEAWTKRVLDLPEFAARAHLCADPSAQAERIAALGQAYQEPEGLMGVGAADPEILSELENVFAHHGLATFNPEGRMRRGDGLYQLLAALAGLARDDSFATVAQLARSPDFLAFLGDRLGGGFSAARFLGELDALQARHLPPDLDEARRKSGGSAELAAIADLRRQLTAGRFPANASETLATIFGARGFRLAVPADALAAEAAEAWTEIMRETARAAAEFDDVTTDEWWELALSFYAQSVRYDEKPAGAVELQGWLELLWEDAPHLVIGGLNDGSVPSAVAGDPFLPESLREKLGLKTNGARFARDAYLLQALAKSRAGAGRLDLLLGKASAAGDPLRPSRLLFRCADEELPARVALLFQSVDSARASSSWRRAWQLEPPAAPIPGRLAVTALRDWLQCPFRFYLARVLRLEAVDPAKAELDALDFGSLCHAALEAMGRELALRDCTDAGPIRDFLLTALTRKAEELLGSALTLPLLVQLESARQRLIRAAEVQAKCRAEGWVIVDVERKFTLAVGGLEIAGKIDRIDRHPATGAIRVLDYKTSDQPASPRAAHLRAVGRAEAPPAFARFPDEAGRELWSDLQLPLYLRAVAAEFPTGVVGGYFNLPKAATETGLALWEDFSPELADAAWRCAEGAATAIRAGQFWPPNENVPEASDAFASLFHHGVAASVAWTKEAR